MESTNNNKNYNTHVTVFHQMKCNTYVRCSHFWNTPCFVILSTRDTNFLQWLEQSQICDIVKLNVSNMCQCIHTLMSLIFFCWKKCKGFWSVISSFSRAPSCVGIDWKLMVVAGLSVAKNNPLWQSTIVNISKKVYINLFIVPANERCIHFCSIWYPS